MSPVFVVACDGSLYWTGKRRRSGGYAVVSQDGTLLDGAQMPNLRAVTEAEHLGLALALGRAVEALDGRYGGAVVVTDQASVVEKPRALHSRLHAPDDLRYVIDAAQHAVHHGRLKIRYSTSHKPCRYQRLMSSADRLAAGFAVGLLDSAHLGTVPDLPTGGQCRRHWANGDGDTPAGHRKGA